MNKEISEELLARFLSNNCTNEEKITVESWYNSYEAMPDLYPDGTAGDVIEIMSDSKAAINNSIAGIEQNSKLNPRNISKVQSWFLKISN